MKKVKISIIMPVYNSENTLKMSIDSILSQPFQDIEVICINDNSTDSSLKILSEYRARDERIVIINSKENEGPGVSRNKGIAVANGDYLSFVDSDDRLASNMLSECYNMARTTDADVLVFDYMTVNIKSKATKKQFAVPYIVKNKLNVSVAPEEICDFIFNIFDVCVWNKIYKKDFVLKNDIKFANLKYGEDLYFSLLSLALSKKIAYLDEYYYYYTIAQNDSASSEKKIKNVYLEPYEALKMLRQTLKNRNILDKYEKSLNLLFFETVNCHLPVLGDLSGELIKKLKHENIYEYEKYITDSIQKNHVNLFNSYKEKICDFFYKLGNVDGIALWGASLRGQALLRIINECNLKIDYLIDKDVSKQDSIISGIKVKSYNEIKEKVNLILVSNSYFYGEILIETAGDKKLFDMNAYLNFGIDFEECFN